LKTRDGLNKHFRHSTSGNGTPDAMPMDAIPTHEAPTLGDKIV